MKKYILAALFVMSGVISLYAQTRVHVYLKNGQYYRNVYMHTQEKEYIIINIGEPGQEEVLVRLNINKLRSIKYLSVNKKKAAEISLATPKIEFKPGMYFVIEMSGIVGKSNSGDNNSTTLGLKAIGGYSPSTYFSVGVGLGLDNYDEFTTLPVFVDIRGDLIKARVVPYYFLQAGYAAGWFNNSVNSDFVRNDIEALWMLSPGLGIRIDLGRSDLLLNMGYKHQNIKITREFTFGETIVEDRKMRRMTFGIGMIF